MNVKNVRNWMFVATLALLAGPYSANAQAATSLDIADQQQAQTLTTQLQAQLDSAARAELVRRIKVHSREELTRQLQSNELRIQTEPPMGGDFELTISNPTRKIRLTYR